MNNYTGMSWFDNDPKTTTEQKVKQAAAYYRNKFGRYPNVVFVHPTTFATLETAIIESAIGTAIEVKSSRSVLPQHFWLGVQSEDKKLS